MKIRSIIYNMVVMAALTLMQSCSTSYPEMDYTNDDSPYANKETEGTTVIKPTLNYQSIFYNASTRGHGAFDCANYKDTYERLYLASKFYVLAFRNTVTETGELSTPASYSSLMKTSGIKDCLVSTEVAVNDTTHRGKVAKSTGLEGVLQFYDDATCTEQNVLYWSSDYRNVGYNFFAYYLDDSKVNSIKTDDDHVYYNLTIDGTQDLLAGKGRELTLNYLTGMYPNISKESTDNIIYYGGGAYSTYAAEHGVQPIIDVKHLLTRLKFYVVLTDSDRDYAGRKPNITIKQLRVKSSKDIQCCVAARDSAEIGITMVSDNDWFKVHDAPTIDAAGNITNGDVTSRQDSMVYMKVDSLGESIMLPSQLTYDVELDYDQPLMTEYDPQNPTNYKYELLHQTATVKLTRKNGEAFLPGTSYDVTLSINGAQRIDVNVEMVGWKEGGDIPNIDINH